MAFDPAYAMPYSPAPQPFMSPYSSTAYTPSTLTLTPQPALYTAAPVSQYLGSAPVTPAPLTPILPTTFSPSPLLDITNAFPSLGPSAPPAKPFNSVNPDDTRHLFPHLGDAEEALGRGAEPAYLEHIPIATPEPARPGPSAVQAAVDDGYYQRIMSWELDPHTPQSGSTPGSVHGSVSPRVSTGPTTPLQQSATYYKATAPARRSPTKPALTRTKSASVAFGPTEEIGEGPMMGLDFGSFQCRAALVSPAQSMPQLVRNPFGSLQTRSVVALPPQRPRCVGVEAAEQLLLRPNSSFNFLKELLDLVVRGVAKPVPEGAQYAVADDEGRVHVDLGAGGLGGDLAPAQMIAMIIAAMRQYAMTAAKAEPRGLVLAAPANWTPAHKAALKEAAVIAGFPASKVTVVSDTMAKMLWYRYSHYSDLPDRSAVTVMVVDVGQSYSAACIANVSRTRVESVATCCCPLGSLCVDRELFLRAKAWAKDQVTAKGEELQKLDAKLAEECRKAKETLSTLDKAQLQCPIGPGQEVPYPVDRALLRECAEELLSAVEQLCSVTLQQANLDKKALKAVELVGGGTRMPAVVEVLKAFFGFDAPLRLTMDTETSVCQGAVLMGLQQAVVRPHDQHSLHTLELVPAVPKPTDTQLQTPLTRLQPLVQKERDLQARDNTYTECAEARNAFEEYVFKVRNVCKRPPHSQREDVTELLGILDEVERETIAPQVQPSREGYAKATAGLRRALHARFPEVAQEVDGAGPRSLTPVRRPVATAPDGSAVHRSSSVPQYLSQGSPAKPPSPARPRVPLPLPAAAFGARPRTPTDEDLPPTSVLASRKSDFYNRGESEEAPPPPAPAQQPPSARPAPPTSAPPNPQPTPQPQSQPPPPPPKSHSELAAEATNRADALLLENRWTDSIAAYRQALDHLLQLQPSPKRDERCCACHLNVAMASLKSGSPQQALESATTACELCPKNPHAWRWKSEAQLATDQPEAALASYKTAQRLAQSCGDNKLLRQLAHMESKYRR
eukprot:EG_transcript_1823